MGPSSPSDQSPAADRSELEKLRAELTHELDTLRGEIGLLKDKDEIQRLQHSYGYFMDNRMFREMVDLFADSGAYMEIGGRGIYRGKEHIHAFLLQVLGAGRWGLDHNEVINHVQQQLLITVDADRRRAWARARALIQGNSPPDTPDLLLADGVYENEYVRENGLWKILGIRVAMTFYAAVKRERVWFPTAPPSTTVPPDAPSQPVVEALGRQFNRWHFRHPVAGYELAIPASALDPRAKRS
jgi:SnoaL-like domain